MSRHVTAMTIDDVDHYTAEEKARIVASYPPHEREARAKGEPSMGSGRVFPLEEALITIPPREIPRHWPQIVGVDFGVDHPFAGARLAWDRDGDCIYVTHCFRHRGQHINGEWTGNPAFHATTLRSWGVWLPVAWPHDGLQHDRQSGERLADLYRAQGLNMLSEHATHPDGSNGVEAGLMDMLERMQTNRFKVFAGLNDWFEEFRMYHRKEGKLVKLIDDLLSATRYAVMMLRFAEVAPNATEEDKFGSRVTQGDGAWLAM